MTYLPPGRLDPPAEVGLVGVHEVALVHEPRALDRLAPDEHERAARPVAADLAVVGGSIELALSEPARAVPEPLEGERVAQRAQGVGKLPDRHVELPVGGDLAHPDQAHGRT